MKSEEDALLGKELLLLLHLPLRKDGRVDGRPSWSTGGGSVPARPTAEEGSPRESQAMNQGTCSGTSHQKVDSADAVPRGRILAWFRAW